MHVAIRKRELLRCVQVAAEGLQMHAVSLKRKVSMQETVTQHVFLSLHHYNCPALLMHAVGFLPCTVTSA